MTVLGHALTGYFFIYFCNYFVLFYMYVFIFYFCLILLLSMRGILVSITVRLCFKSYTWFPFVMEKVSEGECRSRVSCFMSFPYALEPCVTVVSFPKSIRGWFPLERGS